MIIDMRFLMVRHPSIPEAGLRLQVRVSGDARWREVRVEDANGVTPGWLMIVSEPALKISTEEADELQKPHKETD